MPRLASPTPLRTGVPCGDRIGLLNVLLAEGLNLGLRKMAELGAKTTSVETDLFEMLGRAGTDEFKQVRGLVT